MIKISFFKNKIKWNVKPNQEESLWGYCNKITQQQREKCAETTTRSEAGVLFIEGPAA